MRALIILALGLTVATVGTSARRIVGGSVTSIQTYPFSAALLRGASGPGVGTFSKTCGGSIINNRSVLTAAHCLDSFSTVLNRWRIRVGSSDANSGGVTFTLNRIARHGSYNSVALYDDIAVLRINGAFSFNNNVRAGSIAGPNYNLPDNAPVWLLGWASVSFTSGAQTDQLSHVQVWVVNQSVCRSRFIAHPRSIMDSMLCSGYLDVGGRDGCQGDFGSPVVHNNVIVGVISWRYRCADSYYPGINTRVSSYTSWILSNQ
ncbi:unnamed protein product [Euphydryas editha]|uniref:Peptidase S1 domain-containing protein n=1 Tax=Euphydryas editha TaxID=104508 RepID=A0AAU9UX81_EUPED|nr:unnamed protein product [Euphydryas editha]